MIRILLADDQALIRSGIRSLLESEDDIEVVAEAADGQHAVALAAEHRPDIALMDIQMPVLNGLEATRQIVAVRPGCHYLGRMRSTGLLHARLRPWMMSALERPDVHPLAVRFHFVPGRQLTMDITDFSLDLFSLAGRNALVTGGNSGLGRAFSLALAKAGADVFAVGLAEDDGTTRRLIECAGRRMEFAAADIAQPGVPAAIVRRCVETLGSIDILVNSAGIALLGDVEEFGRDQWDQMVSVNLNAAFEFAHAASKFMIGQRSGKIINIASLFSFLGGRRSPAYAATKAGLVGFTKAYCDELAPHNIQVNAIAPGYFKTGMTESSRADPDTDRRIIEHIPAARWGQAGDLMGAAVFLASRASDYVNGHVLVVDGGYLVR